MGCSTCHTTLLPIIPIVHWCEVGRWYIEKNNQMWHFAHHCVHSKSVIDVISLNRKKTFSWQSIFPKWLWIHQKAQAAIVPDPKDLMQDGQPFRINPPKCRCQSHKQHLTSLFRSLHWLSVADQNIRRNQTYNFSPEDIHPGLQSGCTVTSGQCITQQTITSYLLCDPTKVKMQTMLHFYVLKYNKKHHQPKYYGLSDLLQLRLNFFFFVA